MRWRRLAAVTLCASALCTIPSWADGWAAAEPLRNGWYWIDSDRDHIAECYYFDEEGNLVTNQVVELFGEVNSDGMWVGNDGRVMEKTLDEAIYRDHNVIQCAGISLLSEQPGAQTLREAFGLQAAMRVEDFLNYTGGKPEFHLNDDDGTRLVFETEGKRYRILLTEDQVPVKPDKYSDTGQYDTLWREVVMDCILESGMEVVVEEADPLTALSVKQNRGSIKTRSSVAYQADAEVENGGQDSGAGDVRIYGEYELSGESLIEGSDFELLEKELVIRTVKPVMVRITSRAEPRQRTLVLTGEAVNITLEGGKIQSYAGPAVRVTPGTTAVITLADGTESQLYGRDEWAGLEVGEDAGVTIQCGSAWKEGHKCGEECGVLRAQGGHYGAGIGGSYGQENGLTTILGGRIYAAGGTYGAGIGGGSGKDGSGINIKGGIIEASGGAEAAAIGGGCYGAGRNISIEGGIITAWSGRFAAGIGGGHYGGAFDICLEGGEVTASGDYNCQNVGHGAEYRP